MGFLNQLKRANKNRLFYFPFQVKAANRYKEVDRTQGVSTTDLVGRMLLLTRDHFRRGDNEYKMEKDARSASLASDAQARSPWTGVSQFLPTTRKIQQFSEGKEPAVCVITSQDSQDLCFNST